ncbi:CDP-alcohol phosphatidyltransferase [Asanoa hainanensis]|uniref:CDP-alcohol phosphatidyltransferase n=1 Tax=Asanoa hainanensis TaxID=560556 RepID=A0A239NIC2_9ACTN|nr:CDP-alcohol phosphatidyltransferase family protein [Asanoa hainanensis]SNT54312.1 CDP-alcohol phosphatidyltransferase [Asanoa hainanensis]
MERIALAEVRERTYKKRDSWWTVLLVDPLASRLTRWIAPYRWFTPNRITLLGFLVGLTAAAFFALGGVRENNWWLVAGALAYHVSFVIDCIDGKIARLNGTGSVFGAWLDYVFDRLRIVACTIGLMGGQYAATKSIVYLVLGGVVVFLDMFRYLNALENAKVNRELKTQLVEAGLAAKHLPTGPEAETDGNPDRVSMLAMVDSSTVGLGLFHRMRVALRRSRIRPHLVGGIEFQMAVFIIAPLVGAIVPVTVVAGALMVLFELALIYMLYQGTTAVARQLAAAGNGAIPAQRTPEAEPVAARS